MPQRKSVRNSAQNSPNYDEQDEDDINEQEDNDSQEQKEESEPLVVPPLKIKLPVRELRPKRSVKRKSSNENEDTDIDDDFDSGSASNSRTNRVSVDKNADPPSRRSERIFLSAAKKQTLADKESDEEFEESTSIVHKDYCQSCRQGGELILCDYCPRSYHKICLEEDMKDIPDDWCCPYCEKNGKPEKEAQKKKKKSESSSSKKASTKKVTTKVSEVIENQDYCEICNQCGELLLCDTCPRAYHLVCMDPELKTYPQGVWSCPHCEEHGIEERVVEEVIEKPEKIVCKSCKLGGDDIIFCCSCSATFHRNCLIYPYEENADGEWHCPPCSVEPLTGKVHRVLTWRWKQDKKKDDGDGESAESSKSSKDTPKRKEREFFIKWKDMSYWHCSWISDMQLQVFHPLLFRSFSQKHDMNVPPRYDIDDGSIIFNKDGDEEGVTAATGMKRRRGRASNSDTNLYDTYFRYGIRPDWLQVHRIVNHRKQRGKLYYLLKWRELPYEEVTLEPDPDNCQFDIPDYRKAVDAYWDLRSLVEEESKSEKKGTKEKEGKGKKEKEKDKEKRKSKHKEKATDPKKKWEKQPTYIPEPLELHPYQLEGVNWLRYSWASNTDTILADEMGLGKTIQTIVFLYALYKEGHTRGPFLITAPLSTIINWERELEDWAPDFYVVNYTGNKDSRIIIRENELSFDSDAVRSGPKASRMRKHCTVKFHVLLTSYELINVDSAMLGSIDWKVLVVDEAHRLKSNQSLFFRTLNSYNVAHKLLLTGTPLQNNLEELFNLLNFLSPLRFSDMEGFLNEFAEIAKEEQVKKLHDMLGQHLLRRLKADVLAGMPSKSEFIVRVDLAPLQKKYYKFILTRNFEALNIKGGGKQVSLLNIVMDLKKCCNHPYLFPTASLEAAKTKMGYYEGNSLVKACGKLILLQKMLKKLKADGHRVLIFSQMTLMLDILEDFLEYEQYRFERIDGSITGSLRQDAIDRFNSPGAQQFVFLLSTRAGGLGINLATADTVVIYDSDWNPHNDIQALSRAHRIGQANKVMIYRFVTRGSVEERITQVAKKKMMLTHLVVRPGLGNKGNQAAMSKQELDDILKFGTENLFKEEEGKEETAIHYDDKAIDDLLDRSKEGIEQKEMWANEYLSSFKVASYATKEAEEIEEEPKPESSEPMDPQYWEKLLGHHYIQHQENISRTLGKGKRVRKQVNYSIAGGPDEYAPNESESSSDFSIPSDLSENDEDFDLRMEEGMRGVKLRNKHGKEKMPPLVALIGGNTEVLGFTAKHRKAFLDVVMRFGLPAQDMNITESQWYIRDLKGKSEKHLRAYASIFVQHLCEPGDANSKTFDDGVPKEGLNVNQVLARIGMVSLIRKKVHEYEAKHGLRSMVEKKKPKGKIIIDMSAAKDSSKQLSILEDSQQSVQTSASETKNDDKLNTTVEISEEKVKEDTENAEEKLKDEQKDVEMKTEDQIASNEVVNKTNKDDKMDVESVNQSAVKSESSDETNAANDTKTKDNENIEKSGLEAKKLNESDIKLNGEENHASDVSEKQSEDDKESECESSVPKFDFNIRDGGLTELHTLWYFEEQELKPTKEAEIWHRRHDYWLLAGIVKHGYERWKEIHDDEDFSILCEPFKNSINIKNKFMERRLRLLEQALVFEEQFRRTNHLNRVNSISEKENDEEDEPNEDESNDENKPINPTVQKAINHFEDLLTDMKSDCGRIPQTVQRIPPIAQRLQLSQKGFNAMAQRRQQISL